jgi:hypothetical protein
MTGYPRLRLFNGGTELPGSPHVMTEEDTAEFYVGRTYMYETKLAASLDYSYYFEAKDSTGASAPDTPTDYAPRVTTSPIPIPTSSTLMYTILLFSLMALFIRRKICIRS